MPKAVGALERVTMRQKKPVSGERLARLHNPEFCGPALKLFQFLIDKYGFQLVSAEQLGYETTLGYEQGTVRIEIGYEPYTAPWAFVVDISEKKVKRHRLDKLAGKELTKIRDKIHREQLNKSFPEEWLGGKSEGYIRSVLDLYKRALLSNEPLMLGDFGVFSKPPSGT
jgi:hypothetical protein